MAVNNVFLDIQVNPKNVPKKAIYYNDVISIGCKTEIDSG